MSTYRNTFKNRHTILPVIHVTDQGQAERNVRIAQEAGADGCFLINHEISWRDLIPIHNRVKEQFPDFWIGWNLLDQEPLTAMSLAFNPLDGLWVDNAQIIESQEAQPDADRIERMRKHRGFTGLYFGGVAFKHQRPVKDVGCAANLAWKYMDVVTTSGPATGRAASVDKIKMMREAMPTDHPLAIASGITPQNVTAYLPYADCFLVATGISQTFEELDPGLTNLLVRTVRGYSD